jgi:hypothetical protein
MRIRFDNQAGDRRRGSIRSLWLGYLAATLSRLSPRAREVHPADLKRHAYTTSTQRLGLRFTERLRKTFRHRWLRKRV